MVAIIDIVQILTSSSIPKRYRSDLKRKLTKEGYFQLYDKIVQLKFDPHPIKWTQCNEGRC